MHPDPRFAWQDGAAMLAFIAERAFCTIFTATEESQAVFHVPVIVAGPGRLRFHVSRANRGAASLEGARASLSCLGPDSYISPDWYGTENQVPTWNYVAVEAEGPLRRLEESELVRLLDDLGDSQEARLAPKPPWTRPKSDERFDKMLNAIVGFELAVEKLRGTRKIGQNKSRAQREGVVSGLDAAGRAAMADLMRGSSSPSEMGRGDDRSPCPRHGFELPGAVQSCSSAAGDGGGVDAESSTIPLHHPSDGPPPRASRREE